MNHVIFPILAAASSLGNTARISCILQLPAQALVQPALSRSEWGPLLQSMSEWGSCVGIYLITSHSQQNWKLMRARAGNSFAQHCGFTACGASPAFNKYRMNEWMKLGFASGLSPPKCVFLTEIVLEREKLSHIKNQGKSTGHEGIPQYRLQCLRKRKVSNGEE